MSINKTLLYSEFAPESEQKINQNLFQETIVSLTQQSQTAQDFVFETNSGGNIKIHTPAATNGNGVFQPNFFEAPIWFANIVAAQISKKFEEKTAQNNKILKICEMGTGSGIGAAVIALEKNTEVLALDINPLSVETAIQNFKTNKITNVKARVSNLYQNVEEIEKFDICLWNPPFRIASESSNLIEGTIADKDGKLLAKYLADSKLHLNKEAEIYLIFSKVGISYLEYLSKLYEYEFSIIAEKQSNQFLGKSVDKVFDFVIIKLKPAAQLDTALNDQISKVLNIDLVDLKTSFEWHLHIDSFMPEGFLEKSIPDFYLEGGKKHNFDHFLRDPDDLNIFHGNEPVEHASKYYQDTAGIKEEITKYTSFLMEKLEKFNFKGYLEYERVVEVAEVYNPKEIILTEPDFGCLRKKCYINPQTSFYETHFTIPVKFLQENASIFKKLSLKGVSLDKKDGLKYAVMTGLYQDENIAKKVFNYLSTLKTNYALKFEQKWFILPSSVGNIEVECLHFA